VNHEAVTACGTCRREIDPADGGVVYAVELITVDTADGAAAEGLGAYFHRDCYRIVSGYCLKEKPLAA
jgi:hypothetical protein